MTSSRPWSDDPSPGIECTARQPGSEPDIRSDVTPQGRNVECKVSEPPNKRPLLELIALLGTADIVAPIDRVLFAKRAGEIIARAWRRLDALK
jgi:hypothetical protein